MARVYLAITIDVEPDCTLTWHYSSPLKFEGVSVGIKKLLQPLFDKYQISPTYLINNVVLENADSVEIFKNLSGSFELGTHLHPEFIEPEKTVFQYAGSKGEANCCFYSEDIEFEKIKNITTLFEKQFGYKPLSFRAGRFSAGANTMTSLESLGYKVDTSVTPHMRWADKTREKPVDYTNHPEQPYWYNKNILEVPVSIIRKSRFSIKEILKSGFGIRRKPQLHKNLWLRPVYSNVKEFGEILKHTINSNQTSESIVLNMMFHNVEVMPGLSPYCKNETDCANYLKDLESFFIFCKEYKVESIKLSDLYDVYQKKN